MTESAVPESRGHTRVTMPLHQIVLNNFLGGVAWGVGTVVGASVVVGTIIWILNQIGLFHLIGSSIQSFQDTFRQSVESLPKFR